MFPFFILGSFPRPEARAQVEQYAQRLRDYKFKKAKRQGLQNQIAEGMSRSRSRFRFKFR